MFAIHLDNVIIHIPRAYNLELLETFKKRNYSIKLFELQ